MLNGVLIILMLVLMEGLLSADNALVLAILTGKLPKEQQKKALFYGMWGAVAFRAILIFAWTFIERWPTVVLAIKVLGALYLAFLVIKHFAEHGKDEDGDGIDDSYEDKKLIAFFKKMGLTPFVLTIIQVELMDISFSADSILAAFALSQNFIILIIGAFLGILMMRSVASIFQALIAKIPEMESTAYVLIALIAIKMIAAAWGEIGGVFGQHWSSFELSDIWFFALLIIVFCLTFVVHAIKTKGAKNVAA